MCMYLYIYVRVLCDVYTQCLFWLKEFLPAPGRSCLGSLLPGMAPFDIQRALCVNNVVVPATRGVHATLDPYDLFPSISDCLHVSLVHFKAQDPWMVRTLQDCTRAWWVKNCVNIPLLQEVTQLVRAKKAKRWGDKLATSILPPECSRKRPVVPELAQVCQSGP